MLPETLNNLARFVPWDSVPWFDLLDKMGLFERWLRSDSMGQFRYAIQLLCAPNINRQRSARVASLVGPVLTAGGERRQQTLRIFDFCEVHHSQEMFELFLKLFDEGAFDVGKEQWMYRLRKSSPEMAVRMIARCLDRLVRLAKPGKDQSPFDAELEVSWLQLPEEVFESAASLASANLVQHLLPRIVELITKHTVMAEDGRVFDRAWPYRSLGLRHDFRSSLFEAVCDAMERLAAAEPEVLDDFTRDFESMPHQSIVTLLLSAWTANSPVFCDKIINYLLAAPNHRLNIGYSSWGSGNGIAAISRRAISAASRHCSNENLIRIEQAILDFRSSFEKQDPKRIGHTQYLLLDALMETRRSDEAKKCFQELARKFPEVDLEMPTALTGAGFVGSPIHDEGARKMTDDQWLSAMRTYSSPTPARNSRNFMKGGSTELSRQLEAEVKKNKSRFAALALRMQADIQPVYFDAILRGIVGSDEGKSNQTEQMTPPIQTSTAVEVIRHVYGMFGAAEGRWISHAVAQLAERELPDDILDIVANLARTATDPDEELWRKAFYGGDPFSHGINTTRGGSAHAIARLLFADSSRFDRLRTAVLALISDRSVAVRACAVECLLPMLNFQREEAIQLFLTLIQNEEVILETMPVESFLYHACHSHYGTLRELLLKMLASSNADTRERAAQLIAVASFAYNEAKADLTLALTRDEVCRTAIAKVDTENLKQPECRQESRARLRDFFSDESSKVRDQAAFCFLRITDEQLLQESELIEAFLQSPAFLTNANILLQALKDSAARLPDVVYRIAERAAEIHKANTSSEQRWWTGDIATLVLRIHEQTTDPKVKRRCLDLIDTMIELDFGGVGTELAKLER